ncbi:MAG: mechanosensitive ion channel [Campylobacterota bacterium]|nr:mechanosensitive ion channel [Campylobacterota bacterium]
MRFFLLFWIFFSSILIANDANVIEKSINNNTEVLKLEELRKEELRKNDERKEKIADFILKLKKIEAKISKEQIWTKSYASYLTSLDARNSLEKIKKRIRYLKRYKKSDKEKEELSSLISKEKILDIQVEKLQEKESAPFAELLTPPKIFEDISIDNPFDIFTGISLIKTLDTDFNSYKTKEEQLKDLIYLLKQENDIYRYIIATDTENKYLEDAKQIQQQLDRFETAFDTISITSEVYQKRLEALEAKINKGIELQVYRLGKIGITVLIVLLIFFLFKQIAKKYITDNERFYMANKIISFISYTIIVLIIFVSYIENASYLVTILGFASAGIAIAMKDWFMSILGWLVIVFGGSIHVGDRIRVDMDGLKYVGDVMDISLLRITLLEDVTLTSINDNRRAGRVIFIPNNYIFTRMIASYTHSSLKTVWDGIDITITYDSNHKKAMRIVKEITKKYSKGYTDITRKQLNKLRSNYNLKNTNVEPRIFSFIVQNGLSVEAWYLTNAYATLTLRSVISVDIVDAFNAEDDITIAYPTQMLHMEKSAKRPPFDTQRIEESI